MINTISELPPGVQIHMDKVMISQEQPNLIFGLFANRAMMPRNSGNMFRRAKMNKLQTVPTPLGPTGAQPDGQAISMLYKDAPVQFHGTFVEINEQVTLTNQCPILNEAAKVTGICMRETEDELIRNLLVSTGSIYYCTGGTNGDSITEWTAEDAGRIGKMLLGAAAPTVTATIDGANKFGSASVKNAYGALAHTDIVNDLESANGWKAVNDYGSLKDVVPSEWGSLKSIRFFVSPLGSITPTSSGLGADVYNTPVTGIDTYTIIEQDGYTSRFCYRSAIHSGPLPLNISLGFLMSFAGMINHDTFILNVKSTIAS